MRIRTIILISLYIVILSYEIGSCALPNHPLAPPDTSSPQATLTTFLDNMNDAVKAYRLGDRRGAKEFVDRASRCLNLDKEPPALQYVMALYSSVYLKEILDRIELPELQEIPDIHRVAGEKITFWTIPFTEITMTTVQDVSGATRFLFSPETVRNAESFYTKVKELPYRADSGKGALLEELKVSGNKIFSKHTLQHLPSWLKTDIHGQDLWQWLAFFLFLFLSTALIAGIHIVANRLWLILGKIWNFNFRYHIGGLLLPMMIIVSARFSLWFVVYGLHFLNAETYLPIAIGLLIVSYFAWIWLIAAFFNRLSIAVVHICGFLPGGMDAQLIKIGFQILAFIIIGVAIIHLGARIGMPTYSLVTGLGIGGAAMALAGREALSNIIGTIMIVLDRPFKLGDYIILAEGERGEVAEIGLRSTRIHTRDDILISIPNSIVANAKMINESAPVHKSRIRIKVGVAYGSDLAKIEEILLNIATKNENVLSEPEPRLRFRNFGDSALDLELLCWIGHPERKGQTIHELNWAIKEAFEKHGISIPFPQRDIYLHPDKAYPES